MRRAITLTTLAASTAGLLTIAAPAAWALPPAVGTINGQACQSVDTWVPVGTEIVYSLGEDCTSADYTILNGSPTVTYTPGSGGPLVWRQEVERAPGAACPAGWGESWADWANGRKGGPTCITDVVWGVAPRVNATLSVLINTRDDWFELESNQQWGAGCSVDLSTDPYYVQDYCSPA